MNATESEAFFDRLLKKKRSACSALCSLVSKKEEENQWRDFKEASWLKTADGRTNFYDDVLVELAKRVERQPSKLSELKSIWSEYLGAFANSDGGILIWGINAPKRNAQNLSLAPDAEGFADWLREQQVNATDPPIQGVRIEAICEPGANEGFVVCCIPRSTLAPHRSIWSPGRFFYRADDGNRELPAALLRRMFHPQVASLLVPQLKFRFDMKDGAVAVYCEIDLQNMGMASAHNALIVIKPKFGSATTISAENGWRQRSYGTPDRLTTDLVIHPGEIVPCAGIATISPISWHRDPLPDLEVQVVIYAANTSALEGRLVLTGIEWRTAFLNSPETSRIVQMLPIT
jgi:hypothetical protein